MQGAVAGSRVSAWGMVVLASALLVVGGAAALLIAGLASSSDRSVSFGVRGALSGVALDLGNGDVVIEGGGRRPQLDVQRRDRFAFGHGPDVDRAVSGGILRIRSRCPSTVPGGCSVRYRLVVPNHVPVTVRTSGGAVRFRGYQGSALVTTRSGDVDIASFCGFSLEARAESGSIAANTACAPQQLTLRSTSGSVHATVPPGRYRVEAESASGKHRVQGVAAVSDAPFSIQALSSSGDVLVEGRR
jgi:hypothetical protein